MKVEIRSFSLGILYNENLEKTISTVGPSINDVTHLGGEGGQTFVMMCDEGGEGV